MEDELKNLKNKISEYQKFFDILQNLLPKQPSIHDKY